MMDSDPVWEYKVDMGSKNLEETLSELELRKAEIARLKILGHRDPYQSIGRRLELKLFSFLPSSPLMDLHLSAPDLNVGMLVPVVKQTSGTLQSLRFSDVLFLNGLDCLADSLRAHAPNLLSFHIDYACNVPDASLTPLVHGVADGCPKLQSFHLEAPNRDKFADTSAFTKGIQGVLSLPHLQKLTLWRCCLSVGAMERLVECIGSSLQHFCIQDNRIEKWEWQPRMAQVLRRDSCNLKCVNFAVGSQSDLLSIAKALEVNRSVEWLCLSSTGPRGIRRLMATIVSLEFIRILEDNYVLKELIMASLPPLQSTIDLYLKLNRYNRRLLLEGEATHEDWVHAVAGFAGDVRGIFYLLSKNPALCCQRAACAFEEQKVISQERPKKRQKHSTL